LAAATLSVMHRWRRKGSGSAVVEIPDSALQPLLERSFSGARREHFCRLWREVASICGVQPLELQETDELLKLCPPPRWSDINEKLDELVYLAMRERPGTPDHQLRTVGELMAWMLHRST